MLFLNALRGAEDFLLGVTVGKRLDGDVSRLFSRPKLMAVAFHALRGCLVGGFSPRHDRA